MASLFRCIIFENPNFYRKCLQYSKIHLLRKLVNPIPTFPPLSLTYDKTFHVPNRHYAKGKDKIREGKHKKVVINETQLAQVIDVEDLHLQFKQVLDKMANDYFQYFTLRTSLGSVDNIKVEFEEEEYLLQDLARIGRKNPTMYVVDLSAFPQTIPAVLKAINESGLGLNPQQDGTTLYIPVPVVTREHRENMIKGAKALFVKTKDRLRDVQNKFIKSLKDEEGISEDLVFMVKEQITAICDKKIAEAEEMFKAKQEDLKGGLE